MENAGRRRAMFAMFAAPAGLAACATGGAMPMDGHRQQHEAMMGNLATRLDATESKFAIAETLYNYARACDRADETLMRDSFWPSPPISTAVSMGRPPTSSGSHFVSSARSSLPRTTYPTCPSR